MGFTILPDMTAKREKLRQRKAEKAYKARRKYMLKRESFGKQFGKIMLVFLILGVLLSACITVLYVKNEMSKARTQYRLWATGIYNAFNSAELKVNQDAAEEEQLDVLNRELRFAMINNNCSTCYDFSATVYRITTNEEQIVRNRVEVFCDSRECVCFVSYNKGAIDEIYVSDKEDFGELYDDVGNGSHHLELEDYYIKGNTLKPGKVSVYEMDQETGKCRLSTRKEYDLTPDDTAEYDHYVTEQEKQKLFDGEECLILQSYFGGTDVRSNAFQYTNSADVKYYDDGAFEMSFVEEDFNKEMFCLDRQDDSSDVLFLEIITFKGEKYLVCTRGYFLFRELYLKKLLCTYGIELLFLVILSLIIAEMRWTKIKTEYEIEEYRKTITDSMAHDLKTPLMAVSAIAENLKDNVHTEKKDYYVDIIAANVKYMNDIIEHILDLSKSEAGRHPLCIESVSLDELINCILHKYEVLVEQTNLDVTCKELGSVKADRMLLEQALDNLINNAIKYTEPDKSIEIKRIGKCLQISNEYNGADKLDMIELVKPFAKEDKSRNNKNGSGLGLAIVKNLLAENGFVLEIEGKNNMFIAKISLFQ